MKKASWGNVAKSSKQDRLAFGDLEVMGITQNRERRDGRQIGTLSEKLRKLTRREGWPRLGADTCRAVAGEKGQIAINRLNYLGKGY